MTGKACKLQMSSQCAQMRSCHTCYCYLQHSKADMCISCSSVHSAKSPTYVVTLLTLVATADVNPAAASKCSIAKLTFITVR
eukprot:20558-Heterococcus_DN1.PRE.3